MRILYPNAGELADGHLEAFIGEHEPGITRANMILSIDGATAIDGDSAKLSNASDRRIYRILRQQADAIIVGATTAEHPGYLKVKPQMVVVSTTGRVPDSSYICVTTERGRATAESRCRDVIVAGEESVDLQSAIHELHHRGLTRLLCEGGATLLSQLIEIGAIDDLFLTVAPLVVGNDSPRLNLPHPRQFRLAHLIEDSGYLFTRYGQTTSSTDAGSLGRADS